MSRLKTWKTKSAIFTSKFSNRLKRLVVNQGQVSGPAEASKAMVLCMSRFDYFCRLWKEANKMK